MIPLHQHPLTLPPPRRGRVCPARNFPAAAHYCFTHPVSPHTVGRGLDPSAARRGRRPLQRWPETTPHPLTLPPPRRGRACPARNFPPPAVNLPPLTHSPNHLTPQPSCRPPPIICATNRRHPNMHLVQTSPSNFVEKIKKTCKNLLTKVILLAIIIKLSREPSPRRQPLEPLPTACTPFFEENFFKKLSENLLTNERI